MASFRTLLLLSVLSGAHVGATNQMLFFEVGNIIRLNLDRPTSEIINRILWTHGQNIVADWTRGLFQSYGVFKDRTAVDNTTGRLEIRHGTTGDSGQYQVEVNDRLLDIVYQVKVINAVPKPSVWIQPLSCGPSSPQCYLNCDGSTEGAEPVTYSWNRGDEGWEQSEKVLTITNTTAKVRTFSCRMENNVSRQESDPVDNPFFQEETRSTAIAGYAFLIILIILVVVVVVIYYFRNTIKGYFGRVDRSPVSLTEEKEL